MRKICFIILHYMALDTTLECIQSIKTLKHQESINIVVVDNASPNGSGKKLLEIYENDIQVKVICNTANEGFSRGNNIGCEAARELWNPDYYVVTNNDTVFPQKDFVKLVDEEYNKSSFSILGPDIIKKSTQTHQSPIGIAPPSMTRIRVTIFLNQLMLKTMPFSYKIMRRYFQKLEENPQNAQNYNQYQKNVCLMGACMIFSRYFIGEKGVIFEPETRFYYEEYILALYCQREHETVIYNPDLRVIHNEGTATEHISQIQKEKIIFRMQNILEAARIYKELMKVHRIHNK